MKRHRLLEIPRGGPKGRVNADSRKDNAKPRSPAELAFDLDASTHGLGGFGGDSQAQASVGGLSLPFLAAAVEAIEQLLDL